MEDISKELFGNALETIELLKHYSIEFGVFIEDSYKTLEVNVLNTDDTISKAEMTVGDIMYFTENGTMTIPGRHVLEKILAYSNQQLNIVIDEIIYNIFMNDMTQSEIENRLTQLTYEITDYSKVILRDIIKNNNALGSILNEADDNKYLLNLNTLSKYIKCKLIYN